MRASTLSLPELQTLTKALTWVFRKNGCGNTPVSVLNRQLVAGIGSFHSEIVTCRFANGQKRRLFCKFGSAPRHRHPTVRHGIAYEAAVYRHVLRRFSVPTPTYYGIYSDRVRGRVCLVLEYLRNTEPVEFVSEYAAAMRRAAQWLGQFHRCQEVHLPPSAGRVLNRYDCGYYRRWLRQASAQAVHLRRRHPWFPQVCRRYEQWIDLLIPSTTFIHGDLVSGHLLVGDGKIFIIDWDLAALAVGEIDLANLTWGWGSVIRGECELAYERARWPEKTAPADFRLRLAAARLYLEFRWLGEDDDTEDAEPLSARLEKLGTLARRLKII